MIQHRLPVYTQLGSYLGKIVDITYNQTTKKAEFYYVKPSFFNKPFAKRLHIHSSQVINISKEKMIVKDTLTPVSNKLKNVKTISLPNN